MFAYLFLVFYAADAVRICKSFVKHLASARATGTKKRSNDSSRPRKRPLETDGPAEKDNYLRDYIDMRLIASAPKS